MVVKLPEPVLRDNSRFYWLRKRVPRRFQAWLGRKEVWFSLETPHLREAQVRCVVESDRLERDWERNFRPELGGVPRVSVSHKEAVALAGIAYREFLAVHSENPGSPYLWEQSLEQHERRRMPPFSAIPIKQHRRAMYGADATAFLEGRGMRLAGMLLGECWVSTA
jgi:hypothetical protein